MIPDFVTDILYGEEEDYSIVLDAVINGQSRWRTSFYTVAMNKKDGRFFRIDYELGSTELQGEDFEVTGFQEVFPVEVTQVRYLTSLEREKELERRAANLP